MRYNIKNSNGLSLTFKEEFELSKLFISSYEVNKININNIFYISQYVFLDKKYLN